jgi:hypothetical protein
MKPAGRSSHHEHEDDARRSNRGPPTTIIDRSKTENENWNWRALTIERYEARNALAKPPNAAPYISG